MNNISKNKLLKRLNSYSDINRKAIKALNKKIAEYKAERANKHYWHNKMGVILNKFVANKESREKVYSFFKSKSAIWRVAKRCVCGFAGSKSQIR